VGAVAAGLAFANDGERAGDMATTSAAAALEAEAPLTPQEIAAIKAYTDGQDLVDAARQELRKAFPRGVEYSLDPDNPRVTPKGESERAPTEVEGPIVLAAINARLAEQRAADGLLRALAGPYFNELAVAKLDLRMSLTPGSAFEPNKDRPGGGIVLSTGERRAPTAAQQAAIDRHDAVLGKARARMMQRLDEYRITSAPLRVDGNPHLAGQGGSATRQNPVLFQLPIYFNRAARTTSATTMLDRRREVPLPENTLLFVVESPKGDAYCLPAPPEFSRGTLFGGAIPDIPCFFDINADQKLDTIRNGGSPLNGVYMYAQGFEDVAPTVSTPFTVQSVPYKEGYRQNVGVRWTGSRMDRETGRLRVSFDVAVRPNNSDFFTPVGGRERSVLLDAAGKGEVEIWGATIAVDATDTKSINYRIAEAPRNQPFGLTLVTQYRTTYMPIYVPGR
jgi:hypothetical protein